MALYFFHLCDGGDLLMDPEGREIEDVSLIEELALKEARAMISQDALSGIIRLDQFVEVRDQTGELVHKVAFRNAVTISAGA